MSEEIENSENNFSEEGQEEQGVGSVIQVDGMYQSWFWIKPLM